MPYDKTQKQNILTPRFANARKAMARYLEVIDLDTLFKIHQDLGANDFTKLVNAFYPDQVRSLHKGVSGQELAQLAAMSAGTLNSLGQLASPDWVKALLREIAGTTPQHFVQVPPIPVGVIQNNNGNIDQTSTQAQLQDSCVTELNGNGDAVRNLIFSAAGNCVAEVNFANHGGTAVSGHAHVYPIKCVPITGHHVMGTPHVDMADYPALWRQLPMGVNPHTALGT